MIIRGRRVVTATGTRAAAVHVNEGRITAVTAFDDVPADAVAHDAGGLVVMPGVVDTHVHVNEPGRTEWEGFATATRSAAAGGVTTIVDMPLNSIPATTTVAGLEAKRAAARNRIAVDVGFWGGVIPGNAREIDALCDAGVRGFKCFLVPSGVEEFPAVSETDLRAALPAIVRRGLPLLAHAELPGPIQHAMTHLDGADFTQHKAWERSRPPESEMEAIGLLMKLAREFHARVHIVHVSAAEGIGLIREARRSGLAITAETCPHYLTFASEDVQPGATEFKCAPPLRGAANRGLLWGALSAGDLDLIASDHSPCPPELKCRDSGDFLAAWGGIASLQLALPAVWTGLAEQGGTPQQLAGWMCEAPARLAGLEGRKGALAPGADADIVIWDPDQTFTVEGSRLHHRHTLTPYEGRTLRGVVHTTFVRGRLAYGDGVVQDNGGSLL
jgi:allantoinase